MDGVTKYLLVCGEGRLNAFRLLGETPIPALVVEVDDEDAFIMSMARRQYGKWSCLEASFASQHGYRADALQGTRAAQEWRIPVCQTGREAYPMATSTRVT